MVSFFKFALLDTLCLVNIFLEYLAVFKIELFLAILEKNQPENHASILFWNPLYYGQDAD